jgi:acetyl esterase/lipase
MRRALLIFLLITISHLTYSQGIKDAQIRGTIINATDKTIKIGENTVPISESGEFNFTSNNINSPIFYEVTYANLYWVVFTEPGNTIELRFKSGDLSSLEYKGDLKSSNDYLKKTSILNNVTNDFLNNKWVQIHSQKESRFISIIDSLKGLFLNPLASLPEGNKDISKDFTKLFKADVNLGFNRLIVQYPERHFNYTGEKDILSQASLDYVNSPSIDNLEFFDLSNYKRFCVSWIDYKADIIINANSLSKHYNLKKMDAIFQLLPEIFKNQTLLDYWLSEYLYKHIEDNGIANSENYLKKFNSNCRTEIYKTKINELYTSILEGQKDHLVKTYKTTNGFNLQAHIFSPDNIIKGEKRPAIVIFHGGGWNGGNPSWAFGKAKHFRDLGMIAIAAQYRLTNRKDITAIESMSDARDLIKWMRLKSDSLNISPDSIVAYGWSAGAHLVVSTAIFNDSLRIPHINSIPNAMILVSPAVSFVSPSIEWKYSVFGPNVSLSSVNPVEHVRKGLPPTIILEGRNDSVTPLDGVQLFYDKMLANGNYCELWIYDGVGHLFTPSYLNDSGWPQPDKEIERKAFNQADEFLRKFGYIH